jgi:diadenosine tetraphosphate (Ap4A) HIT family hydrolase
MILASKRHIKCFDELNEEEKIDYIHILTKIRKAQRDVLGIENVYYFYNEDTTHHFHTWMVPRYEWMYEFGRSVESVRPVLLHARNEMNHEENLHKVMKAIDDLRNELRL